MNGITVYGCLKSRVPRCRLRWRVATFNSSRISGFMGTCFSGVFHGGLVGRLSVELLKHQFLVLLRNRRLLVRNIHRWLVLRGTFRVWGRPASRSVAPCRGEQQQSTYEKFRLVPPESVFVQVMWPQHTVDNMMNTATAALLLLLQQLGCNTPLMVI